MNRWFKRKPLTVGLAVLAAAQLLYSVGFTWPYIPVVLGLLTYFLPAPRLFRSWLARLVLAALVWFGVLQLSAVAQFFTAQHSGFEMLSLIATVVVAALVVYASRWRNTDKTPWATMTDVAAVTAGICFVAAFSLLVAGGNGLAKIGELGAIQSTDTVSHFGALHEMNVSQHFNYRTAYYPMGFHISTALTMDALHLADTQHSWKVNAWMYASQYAFLGMLVSYAVCYMARFFLNGLQAAKSRLTDLLLLALTVALPLSLFYLLPFIYQGFLNYYYICAAAIIGLLYLYEFSVRWDERRKGRAIAAETQWFLLMYLLLVFSVSMSWPLLAPPLLLAPLFCIAVPGTAIRASIREWCNLPALLIAGGLLLQLVPLYLQLQYGADLDGKNGINALGSIRTFHYGVILAGILLVVYVTVNNTIDMRLKRAVSSTFLPFLMFLGLFVCLQYFTAGELRYYAIKLAFLVEMLVIALGAACLVSVLARSAVGWFQSFVIAPMVVVMVMLLTIGLTANPLHDLRQMYRAFSKFGVPVFYKDDVRLLTGIAAEGKIDNANSTVLHYDAVQGHYFGNMFIPNWVNVLKYRENLHADTKNCTSDLLPAANTPTSELQQIGLLTTVRRCVDGAKQAGIAYYIVTDEASSRHIRELFPDAVIVY